MSEAECERKKKVQVSVVCRKKQYICIYSNSSHISSVQAVHMGMTKTISR